MSTVQSIAIPPHNLEAEKSVLGAVLLDERHLHSLLVEEQLRPEHFYREQYGAVFGAMLTLYENDRKIDHLTVAETLRQHGKLDEIGGPETIDDLAGWVPAARARTRWSVPRKPRPQRRRPAPQKNGAASCISNCQPSADRRS